MEEEHAAQRLEWARRYKDWTPEDWLKVNWSDECSVERSEGEEVLWVFRTPADKWKKEMIKPKSKSGRVSQMIWACFVGAE